MRGKLYGLSNSKLICNFVYVTSTKGWCCCRFPLANAMVIGHPKLGPSKFPSCALQASVIVSHLRLPNYLSVGCLLLEQKRMHHPPPRIPLARLPCLTMGAELTLSHCQISPDLHTSSAIQCASWSGWRGLLNYLVRCAMLYTEHASTEY